MQRKLPINSSLLHDKRLESGIEQAPLNIVKKVYSKLSVNITLKGKAGTTSKRRNKTKMFTLSALTQYKPEGFIQIK